MDELPEILALFHAKLRLVSSLKVAYIAMGGGRYSIDVFGPNGLLATAIGYDDKTLVFTYKDVRKPNDIPCETTSVDRLVDWLQSFERSLAPN